MQAVGLFFSVFFGIIGILAVYGEIRRWLFSSEELAEIEIFLLPDQEEKEEYTLRALQSLQREKRLNIRKIRL